jgi:hypothetical protein
MSATSVATIPFSSSMGVWSSIHAAQQQLLKKANQHRTMSLRESVVAQAEDLLAMNFGDDFEAPSLATLNRLVWDMVSLMESASAIWAPVLVPGADGSIQAEWDTEDLEMLFLVDSDGQRVTYVSDRIHGAEYEAFGDAAVTLAHRTANQMVWRQTASPEVALLDSGQSENHTLFTSKLERTSVL